MPETNAKAEEGSSCGASSGFVRGALLLQEKWVLLIVHSLLDGPVGFNELSRQAKGVNATTLSQRLDLLEQSGLVNKTIHSTMPPRTSYELTAAGHALKPILDAIEAWSEQYLAADETAPSCTESNEEENAS